MSAIITPLPGESVWWTIDPQGRPTTTSGMHYFDDRCPSECRTSGPHRHTEPVEHPSVIGRVLTAWDDL